MRDATDSEVAAADLPTWKLQFPESLKAEGLAEKAVKRAEESIDWLRSILDAKKYNSVVFLMMLTVFGSTAIGLVSVAGSVCRGQTERASAAYKLETALAGLKELSELPAPASADPVKAPSAGVQLINK